MFCEQLFRHSSGVTPGPKYDIPASFSGFSPPRQPPILFVYSSIRNKAHLIEEDKDGESLGSTRKIGCTIDLLQFIICILIVTDAHFQILRQVVATF